MSQQKDSRLPDDGASDAAGSAASRKRPYRRPELVEYGSVAKLTKGSKSINSDAPSAGLKQKVCL